MSERVIIIHSLEQAVTALKVARDLGRPVTLASPPGAAAYTGALWFTEAVKQAERGVPHAAAPSIQDRADNPGLVMAPYRTRKSDVQRESESQRANLGDRR